VAFMAWDDSLSVNIREIDLQHRKLVGMINEFYEHVGKDPGQALRTLLDALVDYTHYHFATEERYFETFSYPDAASHAEAHRAFSEKVLDVRNRLAAGKLVLSLEITAFLKEWLTHHIRVSDTAYGPFFNERGLS